MLSLEIDQSNEQSSKESRIHLESFDSIVQIVVGREHQVFNLHKELLCAASPYFNSALKGHFQEAKTQRIEMLDEHISTFKHFQLWLYTKEVQKGESSDEFAWKSLLRLYVFADAHSIPELQNAVIDTCIDKSMDDKEAPFGGVVYVYKHTTEKSPLRRLFVDWAVAHSEEDWFIGPGGEQMPRSFLLDLAKAHSLVSNGTKEIVQDFKAHRANYYVSDS